MEKKYERIIKYQKSHPWNVCLQRARGRCNNKGNNRYYTYGARGIKCYLTTEEIKELWFRDKAYEMKKPSIDRIDNNGDYEIRNCRFMELSDNIKKRFIKFYGNGLWRCNKCGETKALVNFDKSSMTRNGHRYTCKKCRAIEYQESKT